MKMKGEERMKRKKQTIWKYGKVQLPLIPGEPAWYCENGIWKRTARVLRVIEETEDYLVFETKRLRYCFSYQQAEPMRMALAA